MHFGGLRQKSLLQEMAEDHIMGAMFLSPAVIPKRSPNLVGNTLRKVEEGASVRVETPFVITLLRLNLSS